MRRSGLGSRAGSGLGDFSGGGNGSSLDPHWPVEVLELFDGALDMIPGSRSYRAFGGILCI